MRTGKVVGEITDCLQNIITPENCMKLVNASKLPADQKKMLTMHCGNELDATTTFVFNDAKGNIIGSFVNKGKTTVQPIVTGTPPVNATHITGSIDSVSENTVSLGTGIFEDLEASVRLSGIVGMKNFPKNKKIDFDCIFEIRPIRK